MNGTKGLRTAIIIISILIIVLGAMNVINYLYIRNIIVNHEKYIHIDQAFQQLQEETILLKSNYTDLQNQLEELSSRINTLGTLMNALQQQTALAKKLKTNVTVLKQVLARTYMVIHDLQAQVQNLTSKYGELETRYQDLLNKYNQLEAEIEKLKTQSGQQESDKYYELVSSIQPWYFYFGNTLQFSDTIKKILSISGNLPEIKNIISAAKISGSDSLFDKIWKTINYTSINLMYMRDTYVRIPTTSGKVIVWEDAIQLPNETIKNGGGDCEDLSLLVYSVLKTVLPPEAEVYLLMMRAEPEGHTIVMVIDKNNKQLYLIDPSYSFVNGYVETIEITVKLRNGDIAAKNILPMALNPELKHLMFTQLDTKIAYVDIFKLLKTGEKTVYYEPKSYQLAPRELFNKYLDFIGLNPTSYVIVSEDYIREFPSLDYLLQWINEKLST